MNDQPKPDGILGTDLIEEALHAGESAISITMERTESETVSVTVSCGEDIFSLDEDDIETMTLDELKEKLDEAEDALDELEDEEPDETDTESYEEWDIRCGTVENLIAAIEDRIAELESELF